MHYEIENVTPPAYDKTYEGVYDYLYPSDNEDTAEAYIIVYNKGYTHFRERYIRDRRLLTRLWCWITRKPLPWVLESTICNPGRMSIE